MKKLENFKNEKFVKELTRKQARIVMGGTGTRCTSTYSGSTYCWQDCGDSDNIDAVMM